MNISRTEAVYWYNLTPRSGLEEDSIPQRALFRYVWRTPLDGTRDEKQITSDLRLGEEVWVRPPYARCMSKWTKGAITSINGPNNVSVNGMLHHRLDIRKVVEPVTTHIEDVETAEEGCDSQDDDGRSSRGEEAVADVECLSNRRNSSRTRKLPAWLQDYEV